MMRNHRIIAVVIQLSAIVLLGALAVSAGDRPTQGKPFVQAPDTVSPQARKYLEALPDPSSLPAWPAPDDRAGWKRLWEAAEAASEPKVQATLKRYEPTVVKRRVGGVPVLDIKPRQWKESARLLVHAHGGAYALYSAHSRLQSSVPAADATGLRVISVDYTVAPAGRWDRVTDEVLAVLQGLQREGHELKDIAIYGESAGGGLAAGSVLKMRDQGLGMPGAVVLWSPWADITDRGDSAVTLKSFDPAHLYDRHLKPAADAYADPKDQSHPYVSPVYGDYSKGFPPTLIQGGTREIFLSHFIRQYRAIDKAGGRAELDLYDGMPHIFQVRPELADAPETRAALTKMAAFLNRHLGGSPEPTAPWIRSKQPLTILSANDGQVHPRSNPDIKPELKKVTRDSITVIHLGPDHPPLVKTVYGTVPNTIAGAPYMAMTGDGHYGFVTCRSGSHEPEAPDLLSVIDLADADLKVVQTLKLPNPKMALIHPDGRRLLVPYDTGIQVFEMRAGRLELLKDNPTDLHLGSIAITPKGDRIAAQGSKKGGKPAVHVFSYRDGVVAYQSEVKIQAGLPDWDGPFAFRFTPDGRRLLIPNGFGSPSKGKLDSVLIADLTRDPPAVTEVIPQVADGIESVAIHPSGRLAVFSCLDDSPRALVHQANSHLAVVDLTSKPVRLLYHLPVESLPEGIEFTPDGLHLFVQLTYAHRIAVYDVDGFVLKRNPFVIRVGHGPSSMALGPRFGK